MKHNEIMNADMKGPVKEPMTEKNLFSSSPRAVVPLLITLLLLVAPSLSTAAAGAGRSALRQVDSAQPGDQSVIKRFLVVVGANNGGRSRPKLRYAVSDAKAILKIMEEMGGVDPDDGRLLVEPTRESLFWQIDRLKARVQRAKKNFRRVEVIFYYSGHSDPRHFLLGKEKVLYKEVREKLTAIDADVRIAILDSCASGAFTRVKGGTKRGPFLMDTAYDMKGYAVMTSSSSDEASQESDRLAGSFFTHYLVSGLRGAADMSGDGRITLNEVYQFAFNETLAKTEKTISGPQHPNYNIQMSGTGDVVITDIRKSSALLRFGKQVSGTLFIHGKGNVLVAELRKPAGRPIELGLDDGKYRIINISNGDVYEAKITLPKGKRLELQIGKFKKTDKLDAVARGDLHFKKKRKRTVLRKKKLRLYLELNTKVMSINNDGGVLMGGELGMTFGRAFSVGFAGYGKVNMPPGLPGYGGITLRYTFNPTRTFHVRVGALLGSGTGSTSGTIDYNDFWNSIFTSGGIFYIFEPEVNVVMNLSHTVRIMAGLSFPITDKSASGMKGPALTLSFQFGR